MNEFKIVVENSAPSQMIPAKSVPWACETLCKNIIEPQVVDFGCGRLRNLTVFTKFFRNITLVDTKKQCERIIKSGSKLPGDLIAYDDFVKSGLRCDIVFLICVLHIIPHIDERKSILDTIFNKLNDKGYLVVDVPQGEKYYRKKMLPLNKYFDGYLLGDGPAKTFYRNFKSDELDSFISNCGYQIYQKKYFDKHLVRIYQKRIDDAISK